MFRKLGIILCVVHGLLGSYFEQDEVMIICVPVANCLGKPAQDIDPAMPPQEFYEELPCSPEEGSYSCARIHQCLFNEVGLLKETKGEELLLEFPHFYYYDASGNKAHSFWVHRSSVVPASSIQNIQMIIPEPRSFMNKSKQDAALILTQPWYDEKTAQWYSAGTRFLQVPDSDSETHYAAWVVDYKKMLPCITFIDKNIVLTKPAATLAQKKKFFVELVRSWIKEDGALPYIWGGSSYIHTYVRHDFTLSKETRGDQNIAAWRRPHNPQDGCDCSGLIYRAAQIAGLNYFCKNTTTIALDLSEAAELEEGDLILVKGHVMIISSIERATLIDAASYSPGYGCLREISLVDAFQGVETYNELFELARNDKPLTFKRIDGQVAHTREGLILLKLADQF